jgi:hypothetical protein
MTTKTYGEPYANTEKTYGEPYANTQKTYGEPYANTQKTYDKPTLGFDEWSNKPWNKNRQYSGGNTSGIDNAQEAYQNYQQRMGGGGMNQGNNGIFGSIAQAVNGSGGMNQSILSFISQLMKGARQQPMYGNDGMRRSPYGGMNQNPPLSYEDWSKTVGSTPTVMVQGPNGESMDYRDKMYQDYLNQTNPNRLSQETEKWLNQKYPSTGGNNYY